MGFLKEIQGFFHSITTNDHYASYDASESANLGAAPGHESSQSISMLDNTSSTSLAQNSRSARNSTTNRPVQYRPGMRSQLNGNDIQMQDYIEGQPPLPSVASVWDRLDKWLEREFPELGDDMENGATVNDLNAFEKDLNISLPFDVRESYQIHDGQLTLGKKRGLIYGHPLLDLESIAAEVNIWRKVADRLQRTTEHFTSEQILLESQNKSEGSSHFQQQKTKHFRFLDSQKSVPKGAVQEVYYHNQWIPLVKDNEGNNIALDLAPGPRGRWGQIILFGRDFDTKFVVASCFTEFLLNLADDLEDGKFYIDEMDEDLVYTENGKTYSYFDVLKFRSLALAKSMGGSRLPVGKSGSSVSLVASPRISQTNLSKQYAPPLNDSFVVEDEDPVIPAEDVIKPQTQPDLLADDLKEVDLAQEGEKTEAVKETEIKPELTEEPEVKEPKESQPEDSQPAIETGPAPESADSVATEPEASTAETEPAAQEQSEENKASDEGFTEADAEDSKSETEDAEKDVAEDTTDAPVAAVATKSKSRKKKGKKGKK
ncbi:hypothetical protein KL942_003697 [Ogataea angusta]|uniref:Knr4/Smi1-like domain-containing protein n=1 Tax=Pichia angusta TaxID=870730 RepID=A0ABQ7RWT7_PICAN|nr:hypothetical protein KL942_003697 [Ogataea angusta]KAG7849554.1 hypothetical protein KL940_002584 [Ogataea angusta]